MLRPMGTGRGRGAGSRAAHSCLILSPIADLLLLLFAGSATRRLWHELAPLPPAPAPALVLASAFRPGRHYIAIWVARSGAPPSWAAPSLPSSLGFPPLPPPSLSRNVFFCFLQRKKRRESRKREGLANTALRTQPTKSTRGTTKAMASLLSPFSITLGQRSVKI